MLKLLLIIVMKDKIWHGKPILSDILADKNLAVFLDCQNDINVTPNEVCYFSCLAASL